MKVLGIISSPRRNGNTAALVREALAGAKEKGAEVEEIYLPDYRIEYCKGCFTCMAKGVCPIKDDFLSIREKVFEADGLLLGSPSYGIAPNAIYKTFIDRIGMYTVYTSSLGGKYIAGISTAAAIGAKKVAKRLAGVARGFFMRGYISGTLGVSVGWEGVEKHPDHRIAARRLGEKVALDMMKGKRYRFQDLPNRFLTKILISKVIRNNVIQNKEGRMKAVYENLVSRNLI